MLDAKIEDHRTVLSNITEARNRVFRDLDQEFNPAKWEPHYSEAMQALIRILKEERDKVADLK
jgi:hypothetical protein